MCRALFRLYISQRCVLSLTKYRGYFWVPIFADLERLDKSFFFGTFKPLKTKIEFIEWFKLYQFNIAYFYPILSFILWIATVFILENRRITPSFFGVFLWSVIMITLKPLWIATLIDLMGIWWVEIYRKVEGILLID